MVVDVGVNNCNPGRIPNSVSRFRGEVIVTDAKQLLESRRNSDEYYPLSGIKCFAGEKWGYRALFLMLHNYKLLYGLDTVRSIIGRWSKGRSVNNVDYIKSVAHRLGRSTGGFVDTSSRDDMIKMACSISRIENGVAADITNVEAGWSLFEEDML